MHNATPVSQEIPQKANRAIKLDRPTYRSNCQNVSSALCDIFCFTAIKGNHKTAVAEQQAVRRQRKVEEQFWQCQLRRHHERRGRTQVPCKSFVARKRPLSFSGPNVSQTNCVSLCECSNPSTLQSQQPN